MSAQMDAAPAPPSSGVTPEAIKAKLAEKLGATHVEMEDMSGRRIMYRVYKLVY
jgi:hypothetical protein